MKGTELAPPERSMRYLRNEVLSSQQDLKLALPKGDPCMLGCHQRMSTELLPGFGYDSEKTGFSSAWALSLSKNGHD